MREPDGSRIRRVGTLLAGVVLLLAADTAVWAWACSRVQRDLFDIAGANGWQLAARDTSWAGWPSAAEIVLHDVSVAGALPPLRWTAPALRARVSVFAPRTLLLATSGAQTVALGGGPTWPFAASALDAAVDLAGRDPVGVQVDGFSAQGWHVGRGTATLRPDGWSATVGDVVPGLPDGRVLQPAIEAATLVGRFAPPPVPAENVVTRAASWRDAGGRLQLSLEALRWGKLGANGTGTLQLDPALQPALDGSITASGLPDAVRQLAEAGVLDRNAALAAGAMVSILAAPANGGAVTLPVGLHRGVLTIAGVPLLRVPAVAWE